ncbi:uncharacterized protein [Antedon mediterranea]|uniref:uncharacterized protein isoform X2 n=1 Tax=Antedon mediterranea TaxID=105859 RepID=UPI003AF43A65
MASPAIPSSKLTSEHYEEQIRNLEREQAKILGIDAQRRNDESLSSVAKASHVPKGMVSHTLLQMKDQVSLQEDALKAFQNELTIKSAEMEKLKASFESPDFSRFTDTSLPVASTTVRPPDVLQLRRALEQKTKENEMLQNRLDASKAAARTITSAGYGTDRSLSIPRSLARSRSLTSFPNTHSAVDVNMLPFIPFHQSHEKEVLEQKLHHSQLHIDRLTNKLKELTEVSEQQKSNFRQAIEDLQTKLTETVVGRDSLLDMRKTEADEQGKMIKKLQESLKEAEENAKKNDQACRESTSKVEVLQSSLTTSNAVIGQIRHQAQAENDRRGKEILTKDILDENDVCNISTILQMLFENSQKEIKELRETLEERTAKFNNERETYETQLQTIQTESRNKINQLSEEHEKQMNAATERAMNARKQSLSLQSQLTQLQEMMQEKLDQREQTVKTLEQQLTQVKKSDQDLLSSWSQRNNNLSAETERYRNQVKSLEDERNSLQAKLLELTEQVDKQKDALYRAEEEISSGREQNNRLWTMEEENNKRCEDIQAQLENKLIEIADLHRNIESIREESKKDLMEKVNSLEKDLQQSAQDQASDLITKYQDLLQMYQRQTEEKEQQKTTLDNLLEHRTRTEAGLAEAQTELTKCNVESEQFRRNLEEKEQDFEILKQERDHYFNLLKERNEEVSKLKTLNDQMNIQMKEGEKHFEDFRKQNENLSQWVEMNSKKTNDVQEEKEQLIKLLEEKNFSNQELKRTNEDFRKRLKASDKKLGLLNNENEDLKLTLEEKNKENDDALKEKEKMFIELKESRYEVASLTEETDRQKSEIKVISKRINEDKQRYRAKIVALDNELNAVHSALTASKSADAKAMQMAENMHQDMTSKRSQIDSLISKVHWLEESLEAARNDNKTTEATKDKYHLRCSRLAEELEKLGLELEEVRHQHSKQTAYVTKLEIALDKAASLHADVKTAAENQEQEMTRTKLRYSLEIKELQQALEAVTKTNKSLSQSSKRDPVKESRTKTSRPTSARMEESKKPERKVKVDSDMNSELRQLLGEMKTMLSNGMVNQQREPPNTNQSNSQHNASNSSTSIDEKYTRPSSRGLPTDRYQQTKNEPILRSATPPERLTDFSSPLHASSPFHHPVDSTTDVHSQPRTTQLSPVEKLLLQQPNRQTTFHHRSGKSRAQRKYDGYHEKAYWDSDETSTSITNSDTEMQARNQQYSLKKLEERLQSLSKIGGNLKDGNEAMASLIQNQGLKLKQCRQHEMQLKTKKEIR